MRKTLIWLLCLSMIVLMLPAAGQASGVLQAAPLTTVTSSLNGMIRVWLSSLTGTSFYLTLTGGYTMNGQSLASGSQVRIEFSGGTVYATVNGVRTALGTGVTLLRQSGGVRIQESRVPANVYPGNISFVYSGGAPYVIVTTYIEDYLQGVLPYEMGNSFPLEALKAQAVAARTYAAKAITGAGLYDVTDTQNHQDYRGVNSSYTNCIQAVTATKGITAQYGGRYIDANYGASNGGQTELNSNAWGAAKLGYLTMKDDPYDLANASATVKSSFIHATPQTGSSPQAYQMIQSALAQKRGGTAGGYNIERINNITLQTPKYASPSRVYTQMVVDVSFNAGVRDTVTIPVFPTAQNSLGLGINSTDNELLTITRQTNGFAIEARRSGHGVGMSQRGAEQMARQGMNYRQILGFYYTGIQLVQANYTQDGSVSPPIIQTPGTGGWTTPTPGTQTQTTGRVQLKNANDRLNMRQSPSLSGRVVSRLNHGTVVTITGESGTWYAVQHGGISGYVAKEYIALLQTAQPTQTPGTGTATYQAYVTVASGMLPLRSEARATGAITGHIPNGTLVTVLQYGTSWSQVQYGTVKGYVTSQNLTGASTGYPGTGTVTMTATVTLSSPTSSLNLRVNPTTGSAVQTKLRHGATVTVLEKGDSWSRVTAGGLTGYVMNSYLAFSSGTLMTPAPTWGAYPTATQAPAQTWGAVIALSNPSSKLNLRSMPNTNAGVVAQLPHGAQVTVTQIGDSWCAVTYGAARGYVMRKYLSISGAPSATWAPTYTSPPVSTATYALVRTSSGYGNVNIRQSPSAEGSAIGRAPHGAQVQVLDRGTGWTYIRYGDTAGYIATSYLSFTGTGAAATQPPASSTDVYVYMRTQSGGPVNLRQSASTNANVLMEVPYGTRARLLEDGAQWRRVEVGGTIGYVATSYTSGTQPGAVAQPGVTQPPNQMVINWGTVRPSSGAYTAALRAQPNVSAQQTAEASSGASIEVLEYSGSRAEWVRVSAEYYTGYIARSDLSLYYAVGQVTSAYGVPSVYASANTASAVTRTLTSGTIVTILQITTDGWANVRLSDGTLGYMFANTVTQI